MSWNERDDWKLKYKLNSLEDYVKQAQLRAVSDAEIVRWKV